MRQQPVDRVGRRQPPGRCADDLRVDRLADRQRDFGGIEIGEGAAVPGLGLRHVGRRDVAGVEPLARGAERLAQERDVDALRLDQALVGVDVGVGGHRIEQHALADIAQRLASREHLRLGLAHRVGGLETVEHDLVDGDADDPGAQPRGLDRVVREQIAHGLQARGEGGDDLRPVARQRLRNAFVGSAQPRALGIELRVALVGAHQRLGQGLGAERGCRQQPSRNGKRGRDAQPTARTRNAYRYAHDNPSRTTKNKRNCRPTIAKQVTRPAASRIERVEAAPPIF